MKLIRLRLFNFRQFEGDTTIEFAQDPNRNVTLIHGSNGAGKTALLNAFTWVFYETFTNALQHPENLVNKRALEMAAEGDSVSCWVELFFDHIDTKYRLRRTKTVEKTNTAPFWKSQRDQVDLQHAGPEGKWITAQTADIPDIIGRILPDKLMPYFFFDGERIEHLQRPDKKKETVSAATLLTGEEALNRAIYHLGEASKRLEKELKDIGDAQTGALLDEKTELQDRINILEEQQLLREENVEGFRKVKKGIEDEIRKLESVSILQKERDGLMESEKEIRNSLTSSRNKLVDIISSKGYLPYLMPAIVSSQKIIDDLYDSGKLPSDIKRPFVEALLRRGSCICARPLIPGDKPYEEVAKWVDVSGMSDIEEAAIRRKGQLQRAGSDLEKLLRELNDQQLRRGEKKRRLSRVQDRLSEIREILRESPEEDVRKLQSRLDEANEALDKERVQEQVDQGIIRELRNRIREIDADVQKRKAKNAKQELAKKRIAVCLEAKEALENVRTLQRIEYRNDLARRIDRLFSQMSFTPYRAVLNEDYKLELFEDNSELVVGASTGESQMLSLAFIAAVVEQAKEFVSRKERLLALDSSTFPIVMDSPFGNLDYLYKTEIARNLPALANQVVFLVNRSQWEGPVEAAIESRVGREYVLSYLTPKTDASEDAILRHGKKYDIVWRNIDGYERTEVREVI